MCVGLGVLDFNWVKVFQRNWASMEGLGLGEFGVRALKIKEEK